MHVVQIALGNGACLRWCSDFVKGKAIPLQTGQALRVPGG